MPTPPRPASAANPRPALFVALLALSLGAAPLRAAVVLPPGFEDDTFVTGLARPTAFAFLPDGRVLITERETGNVWVILADHSRSSQPVFKVPDVRADYVERGLLSIAVDPAWPVRPYVYMHETSTIGLIRLLRYTVSGDLSNPMSSNLTFTDPYDVLRAPDDQPEHNGGALRFDSNGILYLSLGEDFEWCPAQDSTSILGRVLRLDVRRLPRGPGGPAPVAWLTPVDNPFATNPDSSMRLTFAMGLRNPFRFVLDPVTHLLYVGDVGDNTWEEFDEVGPGFNGGWPLREGPAPYAAPPSCDQVLPGYDDPIDAYDHDEGVVIIAAGLLRRISGSYWPPHWEGAAFYADFYAGFVRMLQKNGGAWQRVSFNGQPDPEYFATGLNSPVDFCWGPEGDLWWLSYEDKTYQTGTGSLHRIHATVPLGVGAPATTALTLTTSPNPTTDAVTLRFTTPRSGPARLTVFDTQGRVVMRLVDASLPAGAHVTRWDGRESVGTRAAAGVYLIRLETEAGVIATRIVFMR